LFLFLPKGLAPLRVPIELSVFDFHFAACLLACHPFLFFSFGSCFSLYFLRVFPSFLRFFVNQPSASSALSYFSRAETPWLAGASSNVGRFSAISPQAVWPPPSFNFFEAITHPLASFPYSLHLPVSLVALAENCGYFKRSYPLHQCFFPPDPPLYLWPCYPRTSRTHLVNFLSSFFLPSFFFC